MNIYLFCLTVILVILDQFAKRWILQTPDVIPLIGDIVILERRGNSGMIFGIMQNMPFVRWITPAVTIFILIIYIKIFSRKENEDHFFIRRTTFILFIAGCIGNSVDRLLLGYVVDWICVYQLFAFNLADIYLFSSCLWMWKQIFSD